MAGSPPVENRQEATPPPRSSLSPQVQEKVRTEFLLFKEKVKEDRMKLMQAFQSILGGELAFMLSTMIGIVVADRLAEKNRIKMGLSFLIIGFICVFSWVFSYTRKDAEWFGFISMMTRLVTILCLGLFHFAVGILTPEDELYMFLNMVMFLVECLFILCMWNKHFSDPSSKRKLKGKLRRLTRLYSLEK